VVLRRSPFPPPQRAALSLTYQAGRGSLYLRHEFAMSALGQKRTLRGFVAMSASNPKPASAIAQSVVSRDALDVLRQQFAWRQITEVA
jgi:hypothetical protein